MRAAQEVLERGTRCLLAFDVRRGPLLVPMAYWCDGEALWMTTAADALKVRVLEQRGACALYVPGDGDGDGDGDGVAAGGVARVLSLHDPVGLLLRAGVITGAMTGLALRNPATLLGYARDAVRVPLRWAPQNRVVLRVTPTDMAIAPAAAVPPGVAPPLPTEVPADIRRALAGLRRIAIAHRVPGGRVEIVRGWWDGDYALTSAATGEASQVSGPVSVALDADPRSSPVGVRGLVLHGVVRDAVLHPERATFWRGFDLETVDVGAARSRVVLPD